MPDPFDFTKPAPSGAKQTTARKATAGSAALRMCVFVFVLFAIGLVAFACFWYYAALRNDKVTWANFNQLTEKISVIADADRLLGEPDDFSVAGAFMTETWRSRDGKRSAILVFEQGPNASC